MACRVLLEMEHRAIMMHIVVAAGWLEDAEPAKREGGGAGPQAPGSRTRRCGPCPQGVSAEDTALTPDLSHQASPNPSRGRPALRPIQPLGRPSARRNRNLPVIIIRQVDGLQWR